MVAVCWRCRLEVDRRTGDVIGQALAPYSPRLDPPTRTRPDNEEKYGFSGCSLWLAGAIFALVPFGGFFVAGRAYCKGNNKAAIYWLVCTVVYVFISIWLYWASVST